jgi:hypothetical protein
MHLRQQRPEHTSPALPPRRVPATRFDRLALPPTTETALFPKDGVDVSHRVSVRELGCLLSPYHVRYYERRMVASALSRMAQRPQAEWRRSRLQSARRKSTVNLPRTSGRLARGGASSQCSVAMTICSRRSSRIVRSRSARAQIVGKDVWDSPSFFVAKWTGAARTGCAAPTLLVRYELGLLASLDIDPVDRAHFHDAVVVDGRVQLDLLRDGDWRRQPVDRRRRPC